MRANEGLTWLAQRGEWRGAERLLRESRAAATGGRTIGRSGRRIVAATLVAIIAVVLVAVVVWPRSDESGYAVRTGPTVTGLSTTTTTTTSGDLPATDDSLIKLDSEEGRRLLAEAHDRFELAPGASYPELSGGDDFVTADAFDQYAAWGAACSWYGYLEDALNAGDSSQVDAAQAQLDVMANFVDPAGVGAYLPQIRGPEGSRALRQIIAANCEPVSRGEP